MDDRRRSRSPDRERPRKSTGGFRWKEKRRDDGDSRGADDDRKLERGYRGGDRPRSPRRDRDRDSDRYGDRHRDGDRRDGDRARERTERDEKEEKRERKREKREKKAAVAAQSAEPMIVVNVNDRLGTKAAIPCLASDPISTPLRIFREWPISLTVLQNCSKHRWPRALDVNRMRFY